MRFETPAGHQLQVDFGALRTPVAGESGRVYLFVATPGCSRRRSVRAFRHDRQSAWLDGIAGAFRHSGGVTAKAPVDNAKALATLHDAAARAVTFNGRFLAFARDWGAGRGPARLAGRAASHRRRHRFAPDGARASTRAASGM